jgi:DNA-binding transcriptional LysR family regulator
MSTLDALLRADRGFDPATVTRTFTWMAADYAEFLLLPEIIDTLQRTAPRVTLWGQAYDREAWPALQRGDVDLVIGPRQTRTDLANVHVRGLWQETFSCVVRKGHPALGKRWTIERFASLSHAFIAPGGRPGGVVDEALRARGLQRHVAVAVPHFLVAPHVVVGSDLVLTVPTRVAQRFTQIAELTMLAPPIDLPGFEMAMYWHERLHRDAGHEWLRVCIAEAAHAMERTVEKPRRPRRS